jgi:3-methyladenine DNA glycosylase/8-oxoguanine DNA glycosylase
MPLSASSIPDWNTTDCQANPVDLDCTLSSGQAFRWRRSPSGVWWGAVGHAALALWQRPGDPRAPLYWQTFPVPDDRILVKRYLGLDAPLEQMYDEWIEAEPRIEPVIRRFFGLRVLRQPPVECFFAFQCATCNTVVKIERSVHRLAARYGAEIRVPRTLSESATSELTDAAGSVPRIGTPPAPIHAFPDVAAIARADEAALRADLWGYRAPRLIALARTLERRGEEWLPSLGRQPYERAKAELVELHGIGEKVADCICLFSLDKDDAVPVDTHVRKVACRLFLPKLSGKSLTPRVYKAIADAYRDRFGAYAGWAQQVLFMGEMRGRSEDLGAARVEEDECPPAGGHSAIG